MMPLGRRPLAAATAERVEPEQKPEPGDVKCVQLGFQGAPLAQTFLGRLRGPSLGLTAVGSFTGFVAL
jgi:hypothetical protein